MDDFASKAAAIAQEMKLAGETMPPELRARFIELRAEMFQRGIYDPVLVRFDSATAPRASVSEIAEQLKKYAATPAAP